MSRTTINTGHIPMHETNSDDKGSASHADSPMHIVILSKLSGRTDISPGTISSRQLYPLDRDNFDELFEALDVTLHTSLCDEPIKFTELDNLHPDYLYERVPLFSELRKLERQLKKKDKFNEAADKVRQWANYRNEQQTKAPVANAKTGPTPAPENLLDNILAAPADTASSYNIDEMIQDIVAPYVEPKADPELKPMLNAVAEATSNLMRKLMHSSAFQQLETSWRSLYMLIRRLETNRSLKLFVLDISKAELLADLEASDSIDNSQFFKKLSEPGQVAGGVAPSLILGDFEIGEQLEDCRLALAMAKLAAANGGAAICAGTSKFAGCTNLSLSSGTEDWLYKLDDTFTAVWESLKNQSEAAHLALTTPRFMLRLPYGKKTAVTESFAFEELPNFKQGHDYYLWGNSAYLVTLLIAESYQQKAWLFRPGEHHIVENLPLHAVSEEFDDYVKPCAEVLLTDNMANKLAESGLTPIRSFKDRNAVTIPIIKAITGRSQLKGPWKY